MTNYVNENSDINVNDQSNSVIEVQQDYSPGYSINLDSNRPLEGTRLKTSVVNASTGSANAIDFALDDEDVAEAIMQKYPKAWEMSYPSTPWSFRDASGALNTLKLREAVNLYLYLSYDDKVTSNVIYDPESGEMNTVYVDIDYHEQLPYNRFLDTHNSPPTHFNTEFKYAVDGTLLGRDGLPLEPVYLDRDGRPLRFSLPTKDEGTEFERVILEHLLKLFWNIKKIPQELMVLFTNDGRLVKPVREFTEAEMQLVRDSNFLTDGYTLTTALSLPFTLRSHTLVGLKLAGSPMADLVSPEQQAASEYVSTKTTPKTFWDYGGPYSMGGKNTF